MAQIINGKEVSAKVRENLKKETADLLESTGICPGLAVILVGSDPASQVYVRNKHLACEELGFHSFEYKLSENTTQEQLLDLISVLNKNPKVHGILVQLPLPDHLDEQSVLYAIAPEKDVDAFHPMNVGKIMIGNYEVLPCTPAGVMELLDASGVEIAGKNCVVIGRSNIVGKPMSMLLLQRSGTVTICHSKTKNLADICAQADILVVAIGKPKFVTADMVKEGAIVIDVGINRDENNKLCGDVDFESVSPKASLITPVPGGVGPMTITMLMKNTLRAAKAQNGIKD